MKKTTCLTTILGLMVVGCGGGGGSAPIPTASAATPTTKPLVNFSALIFPWFAGSYAGSVCSNGPTATSTETLDISADGTIKLGGLSSNFMAGSVISAGRKLDASGPTSAAVTVGTGSKTEPQTEQLLILDGKEKGMFHLVHSLPLPVKSVFCSQSSDANKPMAKSMYSLVAKYIDSPSVTLSCFSQGNSVSDATYKLLGGAVTFNNETFPLTSGLQAEAVLTGPDRLQYSAGSLDGRAFQVITDATGTPVSLGFTMSNGVANVCGLKK